MDRSKIGAAETVNQRTEDKSQKSGHKRTNIMEVVFDDPLKKREIFAVNLRKKKTQLIIQLKRQKIIEHNSKGNKTGYQDSQAQGSSNSPQQYEGYEPWALDKYQTKDKILRSIISNESFDNLNKQKDLYKIIDFCMQVLQQNQLSYFQQLAIVVHIRRQVTKPNLTIPSDVDVISNSRLVDYVSHVYSLESDGHSDLDERGHSLIRFLKIELVWILTNVSFQQSGVITTIFQSHPDLIQKFNLIMGSDDLQQIDQIVEFISNSASESAEQRDLLIRETEIMNTIDRVVNTLRKLNPNKIEKFYSNIIWCVHNLAMPKKSNDGQITISEEHQVLLLRVVATILDQEFEFSTSLNQEALNTIYYLANGCSQNVYHEMTQTQYGQSIIQLLIEFMTSPMEEEAVPALKAIGEILTTEDNSVIDHFLLHQGLEVLSDILNDSKSPTHLIQKTLWCLSNITAGSEDHILRFVKMSILFDKVIQITLAQSQSNQQASVLREGIYVLTNLLTTTKDFDLKLQIVQYQQFVILENLTIALSISDVKLKLEILQSLNQIFLVDQAFIGAFKNLDGVDVLSELLRHPHQQVYQKTQDLINHYFNDIEDESTTISTFNSSINPDARFDQAPQSTTQMTNDTQMIFNI